MSARPLNIANTLNDVLAWIERMEKAGVYKKNSARFKRRAIEALVSVLDADEDGTPDWVLKNVGNLGNRWANKHGGSPDTVKTYISRAKTALEDYLRYTADPKSFKPRGRPPSKAPKAKKGKTASTQPKENKPESSPGAKASSPPRVEAERDQPRPNDGPVGRTWRNFPLGKGREEFLYSLPSDKFTAKDVLKVACHLVTLAEDFDPTSPAQAQMFALARRDDEGA